MTYATKTGYLWSAGKPPGVTLPTEKESQLAFLHAETPTHSSSFFMKGQVSELCAQNDLIWVAFEDGLLISINSKNGEKVNTITKFQSEASSLVHLSLAATPLLGKMWLSDGYAMYFYEEDEEFSVIDSKALSAQTSFMSQAARTAGREYEEYGSEGVEVVWEEMVASVSEDGTVCLWNGRDKSCEAAHLKGPKEPLFMMGSCKENMWVVVSNESVVVYIYNTNKFRKSSN